MDLQRIDFIAICKIFLFGALLSVSMAGVRAISGSKTLNDPWI